SNASTATEPTRSMLHLRGGLISGSCEKRKAICRFARSDKSLRETINLPNETEIFRSGAVISLQTAKNRLSSKEDSGSLPLAQSFPIASVRAVAPATTTAQGREQVVFGSRPGGTGVSPVIRGHVVHFLAGEFNQWTMPT